MKRRLERIDESIARYLSQLETADRHGDAVPEAKTARLKSKIEKLKEEIVRLNAINAEMMKSEDKQISLTDPDARSMATSGKDTGIVGYNVQIAVDTQHHLIVAHEVTNVGTDRHQLANMGGQARDEMAVETLDAVADRGYYDSEEIRACEESGITVTLPKPMTSGAKAAGRFGKQDFVYVAAEDVYRCPAGERLTYRYTNEEDGKTLRRYWTSACQTCALKAQCTTGLERRITRWEHEAVLETVQASSRSSPRKDGGAASDCGASLRHDQMLDGSNALSHEKAAQSGHRDGAQRARLQHEARDDDCGRRRIAGGDASVRYGVRATNRRLTGSLWVTLWRPGGRSRGIESSAARNAPSRPKVRACQAIFTRPGPKGDIAHSQRKVSFYATRRLRLAVTRAEPSFPLLAGARWSARRVWHEIACPTGAAQVVAAPMS